MRPQPITTARLLMALRDAFEAGREQGNDEATSYEWGSFPRMDADTAFLDLFERWETGRAGRRHIQKALMRTKTT